MDVLSDVLNTVRVRSDIHFCPHMTTPWGVKVPDQNDRAVFYIMSRGSAYLEVEGVDKPIALAGEMRRRDVEEPAPEAAPAPADRPAPRQRRSRGLRMLRVRCGRPTVRSSRQPCP